ncbi:hypothetical protein BGZ74_004754 [Mortierella antarctica]|nr:hypothetical protein BGZ74_004754 [Mortierella antarctica]
MRFDMTQEQARERIMDAVFFSHPKLDVAWNDPVFSDMPVEKQHTFHSKCNFGQEDVLDAAIRNAQAAFEALLNLKAGRGVVFIEEPKPIHPFEGKEELGENENGLFHSRRASYGPEQDYPTDSPVCEQATPAQKRAEASGRSPEMRTRDEAEGEVKEKEDEGDGYYAESESACSGLPSRRVAPRSRSLRPYLQRLSTDIKDLSQFQQARKERIAQDKNPQLDSHTPSSPQDDSQNMLKKTSTDSLCDSAVEMSSNNSLSRISRPVSSSSSMTDMSNRHKNEVLDKAIRETQTAFEALLSYRVTMIRQSSMLLAASEGTESEMDDEMSADGKSLLLSPSESMEQPSKILDLVNAAYSGYESDSVLFDHPSKLQLTRNKRRRHHGTKKSATLTTTDTNEVSEDNDDLPYGPNVVVTNHDEEALIAFREHMAKMGRNQKRIPRPSVATIHSIMAETQSVVGTGADAITNKLRRGSMMVDFDAIEAHAHDNRDDEALDFDSEPEFGVQPAKPKQEYRFTDFLQEPLDRKSEERDIQLVEKEILQSDMTSRFLTANLANLYPSSSPANIPAVILPTARTMMIQSGRLSIESTTARKTQLLPAATFEQTIPEEEVAPRKELQIALQSQIQLPGDHQDSDHCRCSYCTTLAKPSKIPVLSRAEYELAELQSQCEAKDQHVSELLKTVQSLQGQVNVLNAKLLFLHDHHTTRPMRRRTLARHSIPVMPTPPPSSQNSNHNQWQPALPPLRETRSAKPVSRTESSITTSTMSSQNSRRSLRVFPEGEQSSHNSDMSTSRRTMGGFHNGEQFHEYHHPSPGDQDLLHRLGDDDAVSFLELEGQHQYHHHHRHHTGASMPVFSERSRSVQVSSGGMVMNMNAMRDLRYETELERVLRDMEEMEEEPEREGEDLLDTYYYMDAYKTMDQQLYRRPALPVPPPPRPMSTDQYKKHHRLSLPIQTLMSKKISIRNSFRWKSKATAAGVA